MDRGSRARHWSWWGACSMVGGQEPSKAAPVSLPPPPMVAMPDSVPFRGGPFPPPASPAVPPGATPGHLTNLQPANQSKVFQSITSTENQSTHLLSTVMHVLFKRLWRYSSQSRLRGSHCRACLPPPGRLFCTVQPSYGTCGFLIPVG